MGIIIISIPGKVSLAEDAGQVKFDLKICNRWSLMYANEIAVDGNNHVYKQKLNLIGP